MSTLILLGFTSMCTYLHVNDWESIIHHCTSSQMYKQHSFLYFYIHFLPLAFGTRYSLLNVKHTVFKYSSITKDFFLFIWLLGGKRKTTGDSHISPLRILLVCQEIMRRGKKLVWTDNPTDQGPRWPCCALLGWGIKLHSKRVHSINTYFPKADRFPNRKSGLSWEDPTSHFRGKTNVGFQTEISGKSKTGRQ